MSGLGDALLSYGRALRDEPKARAYFSWVLIDDLGTAIGAWAVVALNNDVIRTPQSEAAIAMPALLALLVGNAVAGPVADWPGKEDPARLARWRYRLVVWSTLLLITLGGVLVAFLSRGMPPFGFFIAYVVVQQLISGTISAAKGAFFVDLLQTSATQCDASGRVVQDENGDPREYKTHMLTIASLLRQVSALASFIGLLAGGILLRGVHGHYWKLLAADMASSACFAVGVAIACHPQRSWRQFRVRELFAEQEPGEVLRDAMHRASVVPGSPNARPPGMFAAVLAAGSAHVRDSIATLARFVRAPENWAFTATLLLTWWLMLCGNLYSTRLILTRVLMLPLDDYRYVQIAQAIAVILSLQVIGTLGSRVERLGVILVGAVMLDGVAMAFAGWFCGRAQGALSIAHVVTVAALAPAVMAIVVDAAITDVFLVVNTLGQRSVSSTALRGRIAGGAAFVGVLVSLFAQQAYGSWATRFGQTRLLMYAGIAQVIGTILLCALPRRGPLGFAIRTTHAQ